MGKKQKIKELSIIISDQAKHIEMLNKQLEQQDKAIERKDKQFFGLRSAYQDEIINKGL